MAGEQKVAMASCPSYYGGEKSLWLAVQVTMAGEKKVAMACAEKSLWLRDQKAMTMTAHGDH
jgi:hypothetical protein